MKDGTVLFQVGLSRVKKSLKEAKRDLGEGESVEKRTQPAGNPGFWG